MGFKSPLTKTQLKEIQERNRWSEDVMALLWEIKRLQATVLRADQVQRSLGTQFSGPAGIVDTLRRELAAEPCVREFPRLPDL